MWSRNARCYWNWMSFFGARCSKSDSSPSGSLADVFLLVALSLLEAGGLGEWCLFLLALALSSSLLDGRLTWCDCTLITSVCVPTLLKCREPWEANSSADSKKAGHLVQRWMLRWTLAWWSLLLAVVNTAEHTEQGKAIILPRSVTKSGMSIFRKVQLIYKMDAGLPVESYPITAQDYKRESQNRKQLSAAREYLDSYK